MHLFALCKCHASKCTSLPAHGSMSTATLADEMLLSHRRTGTWHRHAAGRAPVGIAH